LHNAYIFQAFAKIYVGCFVTTTLERRVRMSVQQSLKPKTTISCSQNQSEKLSIVNGSAGNIVFEKIKYAFNKNNGFQTLCKVVKI
jgi:hypothetical protein